MADLSSRRPLRLLLLAPAAEMPGGVAEYAGLVLRRLSPAISGERFAIGRRPGEGGRSSGRLLSDYIRFVRRLIGRDRPDLVHLNPTLDGRALPRDMLFLLLTRLHRPSGIVVTFHGWRGRTERRLRSKRVADALLRIALRFALRGADRILVLAQPYRQALLELGLDPSRVVLSSTMFDGSLFGRGPIDVRQTSPAAPVAVTPRRRILFLSRFVEGKGGAELIAAFGAVHADFPDLRLTMAGTGPLEGEWRARAAASPAAGAIDFPGYVAGEDKARLLRDSILFVLPSATEGMPVALLEAMAAGAAALVTPVGGVPLVVRPGENGELLPSGTAADIEAGLRGLLASPDRLADMGRAAAALAWSDFESAQVVGRLERLYIDLAMAGGR